MSRVPQPTSLAARDKKKGILPQLAIFENDGRIYSEREIDTMTELLKKCYKIIKQSYDQSVEEEFSTDYLDVIDGGENLFQKNLISKHFVPPPMQFEDVPTGNGKVTKLEIAPENEETGQKALCQVPCTEIAVGEVRSPMNFWIPISSNIRTEEKHRLTHFPPLDILMQNPSNDVENYKELYKNVSNLYRDGIHGMAGKENNWEDKNSEMNDWLLYKLMREMLENFNIAPYPDLFYYCIYRTWPNKWSQTQLSNGYPRLCEQFAEDGYDVETAEPWKPKPEQKVAANLEETECYDCLHYMCPIHGFSPVIPDQFPEGNFYKVKVPLPNAQDQDHCSEECWKTSDFEAAAEILKATDEEKQCLTVTAYINKQRLAKTDEYEDLFAGYYGVSSDKPFCEFVNFVDLTDTDHRFRTCREVYDFILHVVEHPSAASLEMNMPSKRLDYKTRMQNFWKHQVEMEKDETPIKLMASHIGCGHVGPCGKANDDCVCKKNGVCSYLCKCDVNCKMRFPGCNCGPGQCKTKKCACVHSRWECNPATCESCNCGDAAAPDGSCANYQMTRNFSKKVQVAESRISGYGLFIEEAADRGELIIEYVGERITHAEAERRGALYDLKGCSYLFNLVSGGALDSARAGNVSRFVNHSKTPNCEARSVIVGGEEKIGFFAKVKLEPDTELTFDYDYSDEHQYYFE